MANQTLAQILVSNPVSSPAGTEALYLVQTPSGTPADAGITSANLKAYALATPTITGHPTVEGVTSTGATGTGKFVFDTAPTLGVVTLTSVNKLTLTTPATGATLTIPDGVVLTGPAASGTAMTLGNAEAVSGIKTFVTGQIVNGTLCLGTISSVTGQLLLANSGSANLTTIQAGSAANARTYTWPTDFGAAGTVLTDAAGNGTLSWAAAGGGSGVTIGAAVSGGTNSTLLYTDASGNVANNAAIPFAFAGGANGAASTPPLKLTGTWFSGGSTTTTKPAFLVEPAGTASTAWATAGTGIGANAPTGFTGNLLDLQLVGVTKFSVTNTGALTTSGGATFLSGACIIAAGPNLDLFTNAAKIQFGGALDTIITRKAAAGLQLGDVDAAAPVAQTLGVQSVVTATSNTAGATWTLRGSQGTGTGVGGDIAIQTAPASTTGSTPNTLAAALTVKGTGSVLVGNAAIATTATDGFLYIPTCAGTPTGVPTTLTGCIPMVYDTTNHQFWFYDSGWKQPKTPAGAALVTWQ